MLLIVMQAVVGILLVQFYNKYRMALVAVTQNGRFLSYSYLRCNWMESS